MSTTASTENTSTAVTSAAHRPHPWRTLLSTGAGNALEWYDWAIFGTFSPFFAHAFFPGKTGMLALLSALIVFAVGFVVRPIGSLLFGWYADHRGRRVALIAAIALAAGGSLLIGVTPTHAAIGLGAPLLLVCARLAQGLGHGGEMPAVQTYLAESAPPGRRGRWACFIYVSGTAGIVAATVLGAVLSGALSKAEMNTWGWRVPFVLGGVVGLYTVVMRVRLPESTAFAPGARSPLWRDLWTHRAACARSFGLTVGGTVAFYLWVIGTPAHVVADHRIPASEVLWISVLASVFMIALLPGYGIVSDRIGRRPVLLVSSLGTALVVYPATALLDRGPWQLGIALLLAMVFLAAFAAVIPAVYAELFPTGIRATGSGLGAALATAAFGGTAPYLQTWLTSTGHTRLFAAYVLILMLLSAAVAWFTPETRDTVVAAT
ncbi:MFS transporter [Nocardia sp. CDC160]|uniref:MFS transporter n=1 Tax=Nocardia sp. CDC160 TaxID=3112166 RepID=UPI002DC05AA1|nr:MFS transporter [Nocardia sp. CDC160]MEC3917634.1 MFS transporter [Nocardia sp. CDC160]